MPRVTLLNPAERELFGSYLMALREDAGLSKRVLAHRIARGGAGENRTQLSRYESGAVIPSVSVVRRLARALEVPDLDLLFRAGYFDELLRPIVGLLLVGRARLNEVVQSKRFTHQAQWARIGSRSIPKPTLVAFYLALSAFARRGDRVPESLTKALSDSLKAIAGEPASELSATFRRLPHEFEQARRMLHTTILPIEIRRSIAAEWVHAWLRRLDPDLYEYVTQVVYPSGGEK